MNVGIKGGVLEDAQNNIICFFTEIITVQIIGAKRTIFFNV